MIIIVSWSSALSKRGDCCETHQHFFRSAVSFLVVGFYVYLPTRLVCVHQARLRHRKGHDGMLTDCWLSLRLSMR